MAGGDQNIQDTRTLDAAAELIRGGGFEALAKAGAAGVQSDWALFVGVMQADEDNFNGILDEVLARDEPASSRLLAIIETCVVDYDWTYWIELWSLALRDDRARELRERLDTEFRRRIAGLVEEGRAAGEFEVDDTDRAAVTIATLIDAFAVEATLGDATVSPNYMLDATAAVAGRLLGIELKLREREID